MHKYIRVIYINKGGSILFNIINIPVFFVFVGFFFLFLPEEYTFTFK